MYRDMHVRAFTPYGRAMTVSLLLPYLEREHDLGVLDEWMLCLNTDSGQADDIEYAEYLAGTYSWINLYDRPGPDSPREWAIPAQWRDGFRVPKQLNTMRFYWYMQDRASVYVRFDDDIVYVHPGAVRAIVDCELDRPEVLACFPMIWNNAICSHIGQAMGMVPNEWGPVGRHCVDARGWSDPVFAANLHGYLLDKIEDGSVDDVLRNLDADIGLREQFSVSCFAIHGGEYADLGGILDWDEEEHWLTMHRTGVVGKHNVVRLSALVSHFTFYPQRDYILNRTNILERYAALAEDVHATNVFNAASVAVISPNGDRHTVVATVETRPDDAEPGELVQT